MTHHTEGYGHHNEPGEPGGGLASYAAIKYTAIVVVVLAILFFLYWVLTRFFGS